MLQYEEGILGRNSTAATTTPKQKSKKQSSAQKKVKKQFPIKQMEQMFTAHEDDTTAMLEALLMGEISTKDIMGKVKSLKVTLVCCVQ